MRNLLVAPNKKAIGRSRLRSLLLALSAYPSKHNQGYILSTTIRINDFSKDYLPFKFRGFWDDGFCFLRILAKKGKLIFLCAQLPNYTGTSITNAIESILDYATQTLHLEKTECGESVVNYDEAFPLIRSIVLGEKRNKDRLIVELRKHILSNSVWIEHYPPGAGLFEEGSFAQVNFSDSGEPIWNYIDIKEIEGEFSAPEAFVLNYEELSKCHTKKD